MRLLAVLLATASIHSRPATSRCTYFDFRLNWHNTGTVPGCSAALPPAAPRCAQNVGTLGI